MSRLTGLDISNASMYDGATALTESILLAFRMTKQNKVLIDKFIHPEYLRVLKTCLEPLKIQIDLFESDPFKFNLDSFKEIWNKEYACFAVSSPNFCGSVLDLSGISNIIHSDSRLFIISVSEALSLAVLKTPADYKADICCGEAQSFGINLGFGGPYLGFFTCKKELMRKIPGRIAGQTQDRDGNIAYTLTLSTREQHIRREEATSNICTNHSLCAIRASIYLSILGANGLKECALLNLKNSHYLYNEISRLNNFKTIKNQIFFNEFVVKTTIQYSRITESLEKENILSFYPLTKIDSSLKNSYLVTATELNTLEDMDNFIKALRRIK